MISDKNHRAVCSAVAHILRQERQKRGLTLAAVAAKAGLSYQMVGYGHDPAACHPVDRRIGGCRFGDDPA